MRILQTGVAYGAALAVTYCLATAFFTWRTLAEQAGVGIIYSHAQQADAYISNFTGLGLYGAMIAITLGLGFLIAFGIKRVLTPLAPVAYPLAGAAAIFVMLALIETQLGGGAGVIGGARTPLGIALQCAAGFVGGLLFAALRPKGGQAPGL